jgi:hypothetical protein
MGLLDAWSRRAVSRRDDRVEFLGEQSGPVEDTFKRELVLEFATRPDIRRAYLAHVGFQATNEPSVALCILSKRPDDQSIVTRVGDIFRRLFSNDASLDVLFLTDQQDADLARVCRPFYSAFTGR